MADAAITLVNQIGFEALELRQELSADEMLQGFLAYLPAKKRYTDQDPSAAAEIELTARASEKALRFLDSPASKTATPSLKLDVLEGVYRNGFMDNHSLGALRGQTKFWVGVDDDGSKIDPERQARSLTYLITRLTHDATLFAFQASNQPTAYQHPIDSPFWDRMAETERRSAGIDSYVAPVSRYAANLLENTLDAPVRDRIFLAAAIMAGNALGDTGKKLLTNQLAEFAVANGRKATIDALNKLKAVYSLVDRVAYHKRVWDYADEQLAAYSPAKNILRYLHIERAPGSIAATAGLLENDRPVAKEGLRLTSGS